MRKTDTKNSPRWSSISYLSLFIAMSKQLFKIVCILFLGLVSCKNQETSQEELPKPTKAQISSGEASQNTVYYLLRHAEKDRSDPANRNPELTERGHRRAASWSRYFDTISLDAVYSTNYNRTMQTAGPTAAKQKLEINSYDPSNLYDPVFRKNTAGKKVMVVGHSNTTPAFVNKILGSDRYEDMDDNNNSTLYVVRLNNGKTIVNLKTVELN